MAEFYENGEKITKDRIEDEEWYSPYQQVLEIFCGSCFYEEDNPFKVAFAECRKALNEYPFGRTINDERLTKWVQSQCDHEEENKEFLRELSKLTEREQKGEDVSKEVFDLLKKYNEAYNG
jgi:hypothetical protein